MTGATDGPLAGVRVLIGRPAGRAGELVDRLTELGAEPLHVPLTRLAPPADESALDSALRELEAGCYDWIGFTAVPAVDAVLHLANASGHSDTPVIPATTRVAAIGPATCAALGAAGVPVDLVPGEPGSAATLAAAWPAAPRSGSRVLLPRSSLARDDLPDALRSKGFDVHCVVAYRTEVVALSGLVADALRRGEVGAVILTSSSSVAALRDVRLPSGVTVVAIGNPTAAAAAAAGLQPVVAAAPTDDALVAALLAAVAIPSER